MFFSGTEDIETSDMLADIGVKDQLVSYLYIKKQKNIREFLEKKKSKGINLFLDSGAHTFQKDIEEKRVRPMWFYDKYVNEYIDFLKKYGEYFEFFVELDIENVVGLKKVEEWRDKIEKEVKREPIVVWHGERGIDYWEACCKRYKVNGFSGFTRLFGKGSFGQQAMMLNIAKKYGSKVHGFGLTTRNSMTRLPFYSVDSTSWLSGAIYGVTYRYKGLVPGRPVLRIVQRREEFRNFCEQNLIDFDKLRKDESNEAINKFNAIMWKKMIDSVNAYKGKIGIEYW